ncbi:MAG TPA: HEAT repeat domain-containing protein, partial [Candidatus Ozemobacteraceae bacterium]|nr:HEAT repeat domain-containing protein [Candidatus Ozemobacteraceae bacterium]
IGCFTSPLSERFEAIKRAAELSLKEAVPTLIEVLYEPDLGLSSAAAEALGKIGDPRGIEPLLEITHRNDIRLMQDMKSVSGMTDSEGGETGAFSDKSESGSTNALEIIPEVNPFKYRELTVFKIDLLPKEYFQPDGSPIPRRDLVMKGLKDNDQQLRKMAAKAAIGINDPDVIPTLVETLQNPYEVESVRYLAAEALGDSGDERGGEPLLKALKDENVAVRYSAATALSKMRGEQAVVALIDALNDENEFVRSSVAYALGTIGDRRVIEALLGKVDDTSEVVRFSVGKALGGFGGEDVLNELDKRLDTASLEMKRALVDVLSQIKNDKAIELLRKALRNPDAETSFKASLALMNIGDIELLDDLIEASRKLDQELMSWLQDHGKGGKKPKTTSSPGISPSQRKTEEASKQFSSIYSGGGDGESIEKLEAALKHESPNVRGCAANALGDFDGEDAGKLLLAALTDGHEYVRSSAVAALGKRHDAAAVPHLLKLIQDPSEEVRYSLAKALLAFGQIPEIIFALHKMAESEASRDVRRAAKMSLEQLKKESEEVKPHE